MKTVDDELYLRFLSNDLTQEEMGEVEDCLIENGESEAILHSSALNYLHHRKLADSLLGESSDVDDDIFNDEKSHNKSVEINKAKIVFGSGVMAAVMSGLAQSIRGLSNGNIPRFAASTFDKDFDRIEEGLPQYKQNNINFSDIMSKSVIGEEGLNIKDPAFILQPDDHSCGLKSQQIILRDFGIDIPFEHLEQFALENNYYSENGTYMFDVGKVMESAGVPVHATIGNTMQDLMDELSQGHRVIVGVDADELWFNETFQEKFKNFFNDAFGNQGGNHALIVAGFEVDTNDPKNIDIVLTDPGAGDCRITYPASQFADAWSDSNCFMVATDNPAPYQYDPISHKEVPSNFMVEQHLNEWVQEHSYQLSPDNIQVPESYSAFYTSEQINDFRESIGLPEIEENTSYGDFLENTNENDAIIGNEDDTAYVGDDPTESDIEIGIDDIHEKDIPDINDELGDDDLGDDDISMDDIDY